MATTVTINNDRILKTFLDLVQIDSPSGKEGKVAAYCTKALEEAGCTVTEDDTSAVTGSDTGNLTAVIPAYKNDAAPTHWTKPLYFSCHMDNVDPCIGVKPIVKDGEIYTDGTTVLGGDDKVGVASVIELARRLQEQRAEGEPHPEIRIHLSVQEEKGLVGAKAMDHSEFADAQGAFCYVLDAGGKPGTVVNGAPFQHSYKATYKGLASHAGLAPEKGISAIHLAGQAIASLPQGRLDQETTTNVGTITGGTANNIVSDNCVVTGELRSQDEKKLQKLQNEIKNALTAPVQAEHSAYGKAQVDIEWEVNYNGFYAPDDAPQVALALEAARALGFEAKTMVEGGGADTNIFAENGLAVVTLGTGMDSIHTTEERLAVEDLQNTARWVLQIVREGYIGQ